MLKSGCLYQNEKKKLARKYHSRKEREFIRRLEMATDSQVDSSQQPLKSLVDRKGSVDDCHFAVFNVF